MQPYFHWLLGLKQLEHKTDVILSSNIEFNYELSFAESLINRGIMEFMEIYIYIYMCVCVCVCVCVCFPLYICSFFFLSINRLIENKK
jgi:hypothetical protein